MRRRPGGARPIRSFHTPVRTVTTVAPAAGAAAELRADPSPGGSLLTQSGTGGTGGYGGGGGGGGWDKGDGGQGGFGGGGGAGGGFR